MVFGSHFAPAMDELFAAAERRGLNVTSGLVLSDRILRPELLNSPETALADSADLILRWHDRGRLRYAVTPRFSLSASDDMLDACAQLLGKGVWFTSHINENLAEIATVAGLFPGARHYLDTYCRHGLVTARSVFAHNVHPDDAELTVLASHGASVAHCPTSNSALGSGLFPLRRHIEHGIGVALGSDVGAGAGLFLPKEALQAYFVQQLLGAAGFPLTPVHLLYLATRAGARALGLDDRVGDLTVGKDFDAVLAAPRRREHAGGEPAPRPRHHRRAGEDLRPGHPGGRGRRVDPRRTGERFAGTLTGPGFHGRGNLLKSSARIVPEMKWLAECSVAALREALMAVAPELGGYPVTVPGPDGKEDPLWHSGCVPAGDQFFVKFAWSRPAALRLAREIGVLAALAREPEVPFLPEVVASSADPLLSHQAGAGDIPVRGRRLDRPGPRRQAARAVPGRLARPGRPPARRGRRRPAYRRAAAAGGDQRLA